MPGLNAAFVNVGYEKEAFLHYLDLGNRFATYDQYLKEVFANPGTVPPIPTKLLPDIPKGGSITDLLQPGQKLLVQIEKEPISTKGPRLSTDISFTGRFMVLKPFSEKVFISSKIKSTEEKIRLRQLITSIKPKGFGVIVRTSAENKNARELLNEMRTLTRCWEQSVALMQTSEPPLLIYQEESRAVSVIRDIFSPGFENIYVNDSETLKQIKDYVSIIAPEKAEIVKPYKGDVPVFDHFNITRQIKSSFGKIVSFKAGAYIIIESTEALHVIDVNSGNRTKATQDQETNALEVNMRAADEIARQLRLRDMGGIIVIDFIDMGKAEHRQKLYEHMREVMSTDRARHNILPLSKFGLMQITRQRVRPALDIPTSESCPSCMGKGHIQPSLLFTDLLHQKLDYLVNSLKVQKFSLYVHPFVEAYIKKGMFSLYGKWRREFGRIFRIIADESLAYLQYKVIDKNGEEIDLKEESDSGSRQTKEKKRANSRDNEEEDQED